jgi:alpha-L-rhamnosidase
MITQESFPGYGYMIKEGATTLWERWEKLESSGMNSHNHIMLGSVDSWFYKTLAGITALSPGWESLRIKPFIPKNMSYAQAKINSSKGIIHSAWEKSDKKLKLTFIIPVGSYTEVWLPIENNNISIKEGDTVIWYDKKEIKTNLQLNLREVRENYIIYSVGSGYYEFLIE